MRPALAKCACQPDNFVKATTLLMYIIWSGMSLRLGRSVPKAAAVPTELFDLVKVILKTSTLSVANTNYSLVGMAGWRQSKQLLTFRRQSSP